MSDTTSDLLTQATAGTPVPPWLLAQLVKTESGGDPNARNPASGAAGLGGVLPSTAANPGFGVQPLAPTAQPGQQLRFSAEYLAARGKALGLKPEDWQDPTKAGAALVAYHGPEADANGVDGAEYARKVLGLDPAGTAAALGIYTNMVGQSASSIQSGMAEKQRATKPIYEQMAADLAADRIRFDKAAKDFAPVEKIPPPTPPQPDPLKAFGSVAGMFAILAAAFSKQPALNAMVGLTGAINGARQADEDAFNKNYKIWKDQTEIAIQNHKLQAQDMNEALDKMKTDLATGVAMARAVGAQTDDQIAMQLLQQGQYHDLVDLQMKRDQTAERMITQAPLVQASLDYQMALASKDPQRIQAAKDALSWAKNPSAAADQVGSNQWQFRQLFNDAKAHGKSDAEATVIAKEQLTQAGAAGKPLSAAGQKMKDADITARDKFKQQNGRDPGPSDEPAMAKLRENAFMEQAMGDPEARTDMAKMIAGYEIAPLSGYALARPEGQAIMAEVHKVNPEYQAERFHEINEAMNRFGSGPQGNTIRSLNVAVQHLEVIDEAASALRNNDIRTLNKAANTIAQETGQPAPTTFDALKQIVGTEIEKAVAGGIGAVADRDRLMLALDRANSPEQLEAVSQDFKKLMAGQVKGLKNQYEDATGFRTGPFSFDTKLLPATKKALALTTDEGQSAAHKEGDAATSKSGKPMVFQNGQWVYQ